MLKKKKKKYRRQYHFTQVYQKSQSYDVWFLRYGVRKTGLFVILGNFNNPENQNYKKSFKKMCHKQRS